MEQHRARRIGAAAIVCALMIRFFTSGAPAAIAQWLIQPNTAAFLIYLETGRDVRFSSSQEAFSPDFAETPPPDPGLPNFPDASAVRLKNFGTAEPDLDALISQPLSWELHGEKPTVLILHTHSTESYTHQGEPYEETAGWRTQDEGYNMLSVGAYVAQLLEAAGIPVIQDRDLHDYPSYNGSYTDARRSTRGYLKANPSIQLVLDLHRDASEGAGGQMRTEVQVDGETSAQLMLVLGTNYDGWEENLALALKLHAQLEKMAPGIMRPTQLRPARFNQDLCPGALLMEVGAAGNTHTEALAAARRLADAIIALSRGVSGGNAAE